jgi:hypothetical protein
MRQRSAGQAMALQRPAARRPSPLGYRIVFAPWGKVDRHPEELIGEQRAAMT